MSSSSKNGSNTLVVAAVSAAATAALIGSSLFVWNRIQKKSSEAKQVRGEVVEQDKPLDQRTYEQKKLLDEYFLMHFGEEMSGKFDSDANTGSYKLRTSASSTSNFGNFEFFHNGGLIEPLYPDYALNFPKRVADFAIHHAKTYIQKSAPEKKLRAFDVGCAVGRTAFELSSFFDEVVGLDYSFSFVDACNIMAKSGKCTFSVPVEGKITFEAEATLGASVHKERCSFLQGDASALPSLEQLRGKFDCVVGANLIDRLKYPSRFLARCAQIVEKGGILVLTSPYTWLEQYTPVEEWVGGKIVNGKPLTTFEGLQAALGQDFKLVYNAHLPFLIRETGRKHQFTMAHCTVWQKK